MNEAEEIKMMHNFINDYWQYIKTTLHGDFSDAYWEKVVGQAGDIAKKHDNHKLVKELLLTYMDYLEDRAKEAGK